MATKRAVQDPKVRRTLGMVGALFLLVVALAVQNYFARVTERDRLATPVEATDDRLVIMDGDTMIVEPDALGQTMTAWLESRKGKTFTFELSDRSFQANSAVPTPITVMRVRQVSKLLKANPAITVHIVEPAQFPSSAAGQLDERRALRLRNDIVASGVPGSHVVLERQREDLPTSNGGHLSVLLTK